MTQDITNNIAINLDLKSSSLAVSRFIKKLESLNDTIEKISKTSDFKHLSKDIETAETVIQSLENEISVLRETDEGAAKETQKLFESIVSSYKKLANEVEAQRKVGLNLADQEIKKFKTLSDLHKTLYSQSSKGLSISGTQADEKQAIRRLKNHTEAQLRLVNKMYKEGRISAAMAAMHKKAIEERFQHEQLRITETTARAKQAIEKQEMLTSAAMVRKRLAEGKKLTASDNDILKDIKTRARALESLSVEEKKIIALLREKQSVAKRGSKTTPTEKALLRAAGQLDVGATLTQDARAKEQWKREAYKLSASRLMIAPEEGDIDKSLTKLKQYTNARKKIINRMVADEKITTSDAKKMIANVNERAAQEEIALLRRLNSAKEKSNREAHISEVSIARKHMALNGKLEESDKKVVNAIIERAHAMETLSAEEKKIITLIRNKEHANKKLTESERRLLNASEKYMSVTQKQSAAFLRLTGSLGKTWAALSRTRNMLLLGGFAFRPVIHGVENSVKAFTEYERSMEGTVSIGEKFGYTSTQVKMAVEHLTEDGIFKLTDATKALRNLLSTGIGMKQALKTLDALRDAAAFNRQGMLKYGESIVGATDGIKNMISRMVDNAGVTKNLSNILKEQADIIGVNVSALSERQKMLLINKGIVKEAQRFEGDASRVATTTSGKFDALSVSIDRVSRSFGRLIAQSSLFKGFVVNTTNMANMLDYLGKSKEEKALIAANQTGANQATIESIIRESQRKSLENILSNYLPNEMKAVNPLHNSAYEKTGASQWAGNEFNRLSHLMNAGKYRTSFEELNKSTFAQLQTVKSNKEGGAVLKSYLEQRKKLETQLLASITAEVNAHRGNTDLIIKFGKSQKALLASLHGFDHVIEKTLRGLGITVGMNKRDADLIINTQTRFLKDLYGNLLGNVRDQTATKIMAQLSPIISKLQEAGGLHVGVGLQNGRLSISQLVPDNKLTLGLPKSANGPANEYFNTAYENNQQGVAQPANYVTPYNQQGIKSPAGYFASVSPPVKAKPSPEPPNPNDVLKKTVHAANISINQAGLRKQIRQELTIAQNEMSLELKRLNQQARFGGNKDALTLMAIGNVDHIQSLDAKAIKAIQAKADLVINAYYDAQKKALENKYGATINGKFELLNPKDRALYESSAATLQRSRQESIANERALIAGSANTRPATRMQQLAGFQASGAVWSMSEQQRSYEDTLLQTRVKHAGINDAQLLKINELRTTYVKELTKAVDLQYAKGTPDRVEGERKAVEAGRSLANNLFKSLLYGVEQAAATKEDVYSSLGQFATPAMGKILIASRQKKTEDKITTLLASGEIAKDKAESLTKKLNLQTGVQKRGVDIANRNVEGALSGTVTRLPMQIRQQLIRDKYQNRADQIKNIRDTMAARSDTGTLSDSQRTVFDKMIQQEKATGNRLADFLPVDDKIKDAQRLSTAFTQSFANIANASKTLGHDIDKTFNRVNQTLTGTMQVANGIGTIIKSGGSPMGIATGGLQAVGGVANVISGIWGGGNKEEGKTARRARTYGTTINRGPTQYTIAPSLVVENQGDVFFGPDGIDAAGKRLGKMVAETMEYSGTTPS